MKLQRSISKLFKLLPSGILIVEPNPGLLAARVLLLSAADSYVAASNEVPPATDLQKTDVKVAVLSLSLGKPTLSKLAQEVRLYYPGARILIFGNSELDLDDQLYDETIDRHCRPEQLLDVLFRLARESSHQSIAYRLRIGAEALSLKGFGWVSSHRRPLESDPSKEAVSASADSPTGVDFPADETSPHLV
ncbi:hypothetical protein [Granulicella tundricola]|nr:hypothetical protein [Granulicella tundricola]